MHLIFLSVWHVGSDGKLFSLVANLKLECTKIPWWLEICPVPWLGSLITVLPKPTNIAERDEKRKMEWQKGKGRKEKRERWKRDKEGTVGNR